MLRALKRFSIPALPFASLLLGACSLFAPAPPPVTRPVLTSRDMVAAIRAAGEHEQSIIDVTPLRDPGVAVLDDAARHDEQAGRYAAAAAKLDQALKLSPDSPDLLQERAEAAVWLGDFPTADKLAHRSWSLGPKLGPLCARNWQTVAEIRLQAGDDKAAATARQWVRQCHKAGVPRY
ncbi:MAG: tetratricopeptide repeat protein [Xanthomonadaceae bacterium]|nr:tetratricopeptide repeat protein [Xanthomonadaceae bacterium]